MMSFRSHWRRILAVCATAMVCHQHASAQIKACSAGQHATYFVQSYSGFTPEDACAAYAFSPPPWTNFTVSGSTCSGLRTNGTTGSATITNTCTAGTVDLSIGFHYDEMGNVKQIARMAGRVTVHEYDRLNRRTKTTDGSGVTQFAYNLLDELTSVTDARNLVTAYTIDGLGNLTKTISPDTGATSVTVDEAGNVKTRTDAKNQTTTYQYDALNRITRITYSDSSSTVFTYDQGDNGIGHLTGVQDASGTIQYSYSSLGQVVQEVRAIGGQSYTTAYRYDDAGHLTGITYPSGRSVDYTRDGNGRISAVATTGNGTTTTLVSQVDYQPFGPIKSLTLGNGQTYSRAYDLKGRMASYTLNGQVQTIGYDDGSRITGVTDSGNAANTRTYGYDSADRLTSEQYPNSSRSYAYDKVGNRTQSTLNTVATSYTYATTSNRLTQVSGNAVTMDANGSTTKNSAGTQFSYDARGRMVSANTAIGLVTYSINALGQRVLKATPTSSTVFHYDGNGRLIAESTNGVATEYVWLDDVPVAVLKSAAGPLDVSSRVNLTQYGATLNRTSGKYVGSVDVTNTGAAALAGPLQLKLNNLTTGVTLDNATGADAGTSYVTVTGPLNAGATISVPLTFSNPNRAVVSYTPILYQGNF